MSSQRLPTPGRFVRVDGVPLHVVTEGAGPLCVLSGGLGMAWFDWDAVAALLAPYRTVVRFDRPGLGLSAQAPAPPTLAAEADRIARLLDALGHDGPATIVGHSLAGFHAEAFARLHPDRCAGVVLVDGSIEEDPRPLLPRAVRTAWAGGVAGVLSAAGMPRALGPAARRLVGRASTVGSHPPHPWERVGYRTSRVARACVLENATYPYQAAELAALRRARPLPPVPVTVLAAYDGSETAGRLRWLERQRALAAELGGRFAVAAPAGHLVMADVPESVARAVLDLTDTGRDATPLR
ncbi:alpha/beta fold hydrolase [Streptomyces endophytica]|uniref:Alpha/beta hydrolase n=1 Tax=Streptomyces endophytica TaxID=2991496 RepID=A0ABY6PCU0_9ACTN|nr:alpha/beta hydrolase [Streptomyces endophytica]UZJ31659.1 alpha/beta hydrolase [Streptomyces endophytica]